ncbi:hypothetical protein ACHAXS_006753 [Conticribra weissflogii]
MSLSFVKSAVLSSTDGVSHNTEQSIDNPETTSLRKSTSHKPLFEQLRANKEAEDEKYEEMQRQMRGTRTLDEEDVAHLDAVERMREEKELEVKSGIEREVALFRAARVDRSLARTSLEDEEDGVEDLLAAENSGGVSAKENSMGRDHATTKNQTMTVVPKFTIKKKRKREITGEITKTSHESSDDETNKKMQDVCSKQVKNNCNPNMSSTNEKSAAKSDDASDDNSSVSGGGLLGLGCYGSDSD